VRYNDEFYANRAASEVGVFHRRDEDDERLSKTIEWDVIHLIVESGEIQHQYRSRGGRIIETV